MYHPLPPSFLNVSLTNTPHAHTHNTHTDILRNKPSCIHSNKHINYLITHAQAHNTTPTKHKQYNLLAHYILNNHILNAFLNFKQTQPPSSPVYWTDLIIPLTFPYHYWTISMKLSLIYINLSILVKKQYIVGKHSCTQRRQKVTWSINNHLLMVKVKKNKEHEYNNENL